MPVPYLNKLHIQTGKPLHELETLWDECKKAVTAAGKDKKRFYGFVVHMLKKKLGLNEALTFQEFIDIEMMGDDVDAADGSHIHIPPMGDVGEPDTASHDLALDAYPVVELPPEPAPELPLAPVIDPLGPEPVSACTPRNLVSELFSVRDKAHQLHLQTKSFSQHVALGDFYDGVLELADSIAETVQGKYGVMEPVVSMTMIGDDAKAFIATFTTWLDNVAHSCVPAEDSFLHNLIDEVQALAYRTKYKLDNLA